MPKTHLLMFWLSLCWPIFPSWPRKVNLSVGPKRATESGNRWPPGALLGGRRQRRGRLPRGGLGMMSSVPQGPFFGAPFHGRTHGVPTVEGLKSTKSKVPKNEQTGKHMAESPSFATGQWKPCCEVWHLPKKVDTNIARLS